VAVRTQQHNGYQNLFLQPFASREHPYLLTFADQVPRFGALRD